MNQRRILLLQGAHSCPWGIPLQWDPVWFAAQGQPLEVRSATRDSVLLRVVLHLGVPSWVGLHWGATISLDAVFPLFGDLRRFWGPAMRLHGDIRIEGEPTRRRRRPLALMDRSRVRAQVLYRTDPPLRVHSIQIRVSTIDGSRMDVGLHGASLQWHGVSRRSGGSAPDLGEENEFINVLTQRRGLEGQQTSHVLSHVDTRTRVGAVPRIRRPIIDDRVAVSDSEPDTVHVRLPSCPSSDVGDDERTEL